MLFLLLAHSLLFLLTMQFVLDASYEQIVDLTTLAPLNGLAALLIVNLFVTLGLLHALPLYQLTLLFQLFGIVDIQLVFVETHEGILLHLVFQLTASLLLQLTIQFLFHFLLELTLALCFQLLLLLEHLGVEFH